MHECPSVTCHWIVQVCSNQGSLIWDDPRMYIDELIFKFVYLSADFTRCDVRDIWLQLINYSSSIYTLEDKLFAWSDSHQDLTSESLTNTSQKVVNDTSRPSVSIT